MTAVARDNEGNSTPPATDDATVTVLNVAPVFSGRQAGVAQRAARAGGTVTFTVWVTNPGTAEELTLESLKDNVYGDLAGKGTCTVPQTIAPLGQYSCTFPGDVTGDAGSRHTDTVTRVAKDDDGNQVSDSGEALVEIKDVKPAVLVAKSAAPSTLPEPGGIASFTVTVTNPDTAVEPITVTSLVDSVFGNVNKKGTCDLPTTLDPGEEYTCSFPGPIAGNAGFVHTDEVTGTASDNEENQVTGKDDATVTLSDVLPAIKLDKTAAASTVHVGDQVTYTYAVRDLGIEPLRDVTVSDDKCSPVTLSGGDIDKDSVLDLEETWTYTCTTKLTGDTTNTATGTGEDDDGNTATDVDTATVTVVDPRIVLDKVAGVREITAGGSVSYTYTVTNPGNAPLSGVVVTDDKCGPVTLTGGDTDGDSLLDPGESWKFGCTTILSNVGQIDDGTVDGEHRSAGIIGGLHKIAADGRRTSRCCRRRSPSRRPDCPWCSRGPSRPCR